MRYKEVLTSFRPQLNKYRFFCGDGIGWWMGGMGRLQQTIYP